ILCLKFFCNGVNDYSQGRLKTAKRRIWCLQEAGFLRSFRFGKEPNGFYVTKKGVALLKEKRPEILHLAPVQGVHIALSEHSKRIHFSRLSLELTGESDGWRSERRLKFSELDVQKSVFEGRFPHYLPDGVFINKGIKTIFEYEHAEKTQKQMEDKVIQIQRLLDFFPSRYDEVLIVSSTEKQMNLYQKILKNNAKFKVIYFNVLLKSGGIYEHFTKG
ncbi:hypothetical protein K2X05_07550, partial [bacterium]|nr:hypothetical protein [bacterium]